MDVERIRKDFTFPETSPIVTISPTRKGLSESKIKPETKLATISCKPNPNPTPNAAISHWTLLHVILMVPNAIRNPIVKMMYFDKVIMAYLSPG